jgi:hypothetical protein
VNKENSDLASVTTDDSEPAIGFYLGSTSISLDTVRVLLLSSQLARMREANPWKPLRQQALDLLSTPAMLAEVERGFSSAKQTQIANNTINYNGLPN